ncbi:MAG: (2Fe-2S)-binding protein [Candidatus Binatia bacterium]|nr:(2Fe-2S)-binding protein [Candidatus Binatia bacterium]
MRHKISLTVNGKSCNLEVDSQRTLLDVLRRDLALTGTKEGCGMGDCGTCTVLLNGKPINSCLTLAVEADGQKIETIEGVASDGKLHPIQQAFIDHGGVQCGFCTPGMILSAKALLENNPRPTELEVRTAIAGNLCRCTGYDKIVKAIMSVR